MTTMAHTWRPSPAEVQFMRNVFAERVPDSEPNREQFWRNITSVSNKASFDSAIKALKQRPRVQTAPVYVPPARPEMPKLNFATEAGLYRDPSDGTLYRLSIGKPQHSWQGEGVKSISVYSNKAVYRRLTPEGRMVKKGKWNRLKSHDRDTMLGFTWAERNGRAPIGTKLLAEWLMDDQEKLEWAVGFCLICSRSLIDAVSVYNSIGPVCADRMGVHLHMPPEA